MQASATEKSASNTTSHSINVDAEEIKKFEEVAHRWWDTKSEFKPLHDINPLRLNFIEEHAISLKDKKVIDVGCGGGILSESIAKKGADTLGIDMGAAPLSVAELHALEQEITNIQYQQITVEEIAEQQAGQFDIVTCMEMLEHVPDPASIIHACAKLVKPGGHVFFSTINRNPKSYAMAIIGAEYLLKLVPKGTHQHAKFLKPSEIESWGRSASLKLAHISGMTYNPITQQYKLANDVDVNYLMHFTK